MKTGDVFKFTTRRVVNFTEVLRRYACMHGGSEYDLAQVLKARDCPIKSEACSSSLAPPPAVTSDDDPLVVVADENNRKDVKPASSKTGKSIS